MSCLKGLTFRISPEFKEAKTEKLQALIMSNGGEIINLNYQEILLSWGKKLFDYYITDTDSENYQISLGTVMYPAIGVDHLEEFIEQMKKIEYINNLDNKHGK